MVHNRTQLCVDPVHSSSDEEIHEDPRKEPRDHASKLAQRFGDIPGVKVGATWNTREQCSFAGVHRPFMAGIHGNKKSGAYSIVISCHYIDDKDLGDTIIYTGAGGRQRFSAASGKRLRIGPQVHDQSWSDRGNEALVVSCETRNPVRVIRSHKHVSDYAPEEGYRYDGLYTVQDTWQAKNSDGLVICRYKMQRVPGQPPIPRRSLEGITQEPTSKKLSSVSVGTPGTAATTSQVSPVNPSGNVAPLPVAHLTPLQRHKLRVMQEVQRLEQMMEQSYSVRRS